jgi:hypothetical protein
MNSVLFNAAPIKIVIPTGAGIQFFFKTSGCPRLTTCRGRLLKSGKTEKEN